MRWLWPLEMLMLPVAVPLAWLGARVGRRTIEDHADLKVTEAEVEALVDEGERSGLFASEPAEMIRNVLEFVDRTANDVMVPRTRVEAIEVTMPLEDVRRMVSESGHSRYPVYRDELDNIVGLLYAKDLFSVAHPCDAASHGNEKLALRVEDLVRSPANFVAESQPLSSLLREMRSCRQHLAIVVDELGSVSGIVTLEDVLEEIVGEIRDEHDTDEVAIEELSDGRLVADAGVTMRDLGAFLGSRVATDREDQSLGRMLTESAGGVPEVGAVFSKYGLQFVVRDRDDKGIGKVESYGAEARPPRSPLLPVHEKTKLGARNADYSNPASKHAEELGCMMTARLSSLVCVMALFGCVPDRPIPALGPIPRAPAEAKLKRGINAGNALDAPSEGAWNVVLDSAYFDAVAKAGFDHVRIPIRFNAHAGSAPPYTVDETFFQRVDGPCTRPNRGG